MPYFDKKRKGHVDLSGNPLKCQCDVQWLGNSNMLWKNMIIADCTNGSPLQNIDVKLLNKV